MDQKRDQEWQKVRNVEDQNVYQSNLTGKKGEKVTES